MSLSTPSATGGPIAVPASAAPAGSSVVGVFLIEALNSPAMAWMTLALPVYTKSALGWASQENLFLLAALYTAYIAGALAAAPLTRRLGGVVMLAGAFGLMAALLLLPVIWASSAVLVAAVLVYSFVGAATWPILESMAVVGADAAGMSRRVGIYNLVWATTAAVAVGLSGWIVDVWPQLVLLLAALLHGVSVVLCLTAKLPVPDPAHHTAMAPPEPALLRQRRLAMWLSRIALPATYVAINSVAALVPFLISLRGASATTISLLTCLWMFARVATFAWLGVSQWWHTRPVLLIGAIALMLVGFLAMAVPPSTIFTATDANVAAPGATPFAAALATDAVDAASAGTATSVPHTPLMWLDMLVLVAAQLAFGVGVGWIYAASLYFGMVLSSGSTDHGGYHEALIGFGGVLGPLVGALAGLLLGGLLGPWVIPVSVAVVIVIALLGAIVVTQRTTPTKATPAQPLV